MKEGNWVAVDKKVVSFLPKKRPFTVIEALLSVSIDLDTIIYKWTSKGKGTEKIPETPEEAIELLRSHISLSAYASLWGWSRNKTRRFIKGLAGSSGHVADRKGTGKGHPIRLVINNIQMVADGLGTGKGQVRDTSNDPSIPYNKSKDKGQSKRPKKKPLTDEQFIQYLRTNETYQSINIEREKGKCQIWCVQKGIAFTQRRFLNWLNRIEQPMEVKNERIATGDSSSGYPVDIVD